VTRSAMKAMRSVCIGKRVFGAGRRHAVQRAAIVVDETARGKVAPPVIPEHMGMCVRIGLAARAQGCQRTAGVPARWSRVELPSQDTYDRIRDSRERTLSFLTRAATEPLYRSSQSPSPEAPRLPHPGGGLRCLNLSVAVQVEFRPRRHS
jgi:hypothetical protein